MSALTSLLIRDRIVPLEKIEEAIQKQVISGGELDTALLELGLVNENTIAAYCAATHGVLPATRDEVMMVDRDTIRVVPKEVAEKRRIVPLRAQEGSLVVAVSRPLPVDVEQQLAFLLGAELVQRVVTEVRIAAALHHHFGLAMSPRHRRLVEKLRQVAAGSIPFVEPGGAARIDPARLAGATEIEETLEEDDAESTMEDGATGPDSTGDADTERAEIMASEAADQGPPRGFTGAPGGPTTARYGIPRSGAQEESATKPVAVHQRKLRRGPLTTDDAARELKEARSKDDILDTLLAFAEQYFDYTALFTVRQGEAMGRLASGQGPTSAEVRNVRLALDMPGTFRDAMSICAPRHSRFEGTEADRLAVAALRRQDQGPGVVLPIAIRERVVILLYGDRGGDDFNLSDIPEVLALLPYATRAFASLLMAKKLGGFRASSPSPESPVKLSTAALPPKKASFKPELEGDEGARVTLVDPPKPPRPAAFDVLGVPRSAPPPPMPAQTAREGGHEPGDSASPTSLEPDGEPEPPADDEPEPPAERAALAEPPTVEPSAEGDDYDEPKLDVVEEDEPELEMGDVDDDDWDDELEDWDDSEQEEPVAAQGPRPRTPSSSPASSVYMLSGVTSDHVDQPKPKAPDRRREEGGAPPSEEIIIVTEVNAVTPADSPHASRLSAPPPTEAKVIVDMGVAVEDAVLDLMRCGPGDELPAVGRVIRVGDAALPVLVREFPGPLWFDRHEPHRKLPRGRDICAIARALVALGERAITYLPALIDDPADTERRFYATLLASEMPHPELVPALGRRLLDDDAGVRDLATDVLRLHRIFGEPMVTLLEGVRAMAKVPRSDDERRVRAVDALGRLHDTRSLRTLVDLLGCESRPLRTAARWALVSLTKQDLGRSQKDWTAWASAHGNEHRIEWLIDALMHDDEKIRASAATELKRLTQQYHGYHHHQSRHDRSVAQRRYRAWWEQDGRALFAQNAPEA